MTIKSAVTALALAAGLVAGPAFAQTMVGTMEFSEADLPSVQAYCDQLGLENQNDSTAGENPEDATNLDSDQSRADGTTDSDNPDESDVASGTLDLSAITIDDCRAAELID